MLGGPEGKLLSWIDTSDNEDGFRIVAQTGDEELRFEVGANQNTLALPPEALPSCPERPSVRYQVFAFNEVGNSEPAIGGSPILECFFPTFSPTPVPTLPPDLPDTGGEPATAGGRAPYFLWALLALALALPVLACAWRLGGDGPSRRGRRIPK